MNVLRSLTYRIRGLALGLLSRTLRQAPADANNIPVVINNFNRLDTLLQLCQGLESRGISNIIILDNASTYLPLLQWYTDSCPYPVIRLGANLGFKAVWLSPLTRHLRRDWMVYTDADVALDPDCPADIMDRMLRVLTHEHPFALKAGPSLRIDNLPDTYTNREAVVTHETPFWSRPSADGSLYRAPIDTTFALYRPGAGLCRSRSAESYRLAPPYTLRHLPWYADSLNPTPEESFYRNACTQPTQWTQ